MGNDILIRIGIPIITGLIGFLIANRLAIDRDKRREFNAIIEPTRICLIRQKEGISPDTISPSNIDFALIRERLPFWKRGKFDKALQNYQQSKGKQNQGRDQYGASFYKDQSLIIHSIDDLLKIIKLH